MAKKEEQKTVTHTEFYNEVVQKLKEYGRQISSPESVAFMVDEENDDICVDFRYSNMQEEDLRFLYEKATSTLFD